VTEVHFVLFHLKLNVM